MKKSAISEGKIELTSTIDGLFKVNREELFKVNSFGKMMISTRRDLLEEASNIGDLKKYNMLLQNISLSSNVKNYLNNNRKK